MRTTLPSILVALVLALVAGCASGTSKSARHAIVPAGTHGQETSWTPTEEDIARLEKKLAHLFTTPSAIIAGLADGIPPYPLSNYNIRYTGTGPNESRYILGEAVHKSLPDAETLLSDNNFKMPDKGGPRYFTVMHKLSDERIVAVRFNPE
jgi:hypothetical protein